MCFKDKNEVPISINDIIEYNGLTYKIKAIESYDCATVVISENLKTLSIETLLLQDIRKI